MKIAVDAMGGDHAPQAVVEGAIAAAREFGMEIVLVGQRELLERELNKHSVDRLPLTVSHASQAIGMGESPSLALRKKEEASIRVAMELVKAGQADAVVSAGNTGASMVAAQLVLRPLSGVDRPAIAIILPNLEGACVLLDVGASVNCKSTQLFQYGIMGQAYAKHVLHKPNPTIGLLGIGEEDIKGTEVTKEALLMFRQSSMNFIGNIEGLEIYRGGVDVAVCDGFTGNIVLKVSESLAELMERRWRQCLTRSLRGRLVRLLLNSDFDVLRQFDYASSGGAPLLGVNGVCIIGHGRSTGRAIKNAIRLAGELVTNHIDRHIQEDIELNAEMRHAQDRKGWFWRHIRDSIHSPQGKGMRP